MTTRQLVTSKLFQPPGFTSSLTGDNHKPQVLKQKTEPTRHSLLEVIWDLWFAYLMLSAEPTRQLVRSSGKNERLGAISLWKWLEGWFLCRKLVLRSRVKTASSSQLQKPSPVYSGLVFKPLQGIFPTPFSPLTAAGAHTPSRLLCLSILNAFFQPCLPYPHNFQLYLL